MTDSDGRDIIFYAVMANNHDLVDILIKKQANSLRTDITDALSKNPVHYAVNPQPLGSYENVEILRLLAKAGYNLE